VQHILEDALEKSRARHIRKSKKQKRDAITAAPSSCFQELQQPQLHATVAAAEMTMDIGVYARAAELIRSQGGDATPALIAVVAGRLASQQAAAARQPPVRSVFESMTGSVKNEASARLLLRAARSTALPAAATAAAPCAMWQGAIMQQRRTKTPPAQELYQPAVAAITPYAQQGHVPAACSSGPHSVSCASGAVSWDVDSSADDAHERCSLVCGSATSAILQQQVAPAHMEPAEACAAPPPGGYGGTKRRRAAAAADANGCASPPEQQQRQRPHQQQPAATDDTLDQCGVVSLEDDPCRPAPSQLQPGRSCSSPAACGLGRSGSIQKPPSCVLQQQHSSSSLGMQAMLHPPPFKHSTAQQGLQSSNASVRGSTTNMCALERLSSWFASGELPEQLLAAPPAASTAGRLQPAVQQQQQQQVTPALMSAVPGQSSTSPAVAAAALLQNVGSGPATSATGMTAGDPSGCRWYQPPLGTSGDAQKTPLTPQCSNASEPALAIAAAAAAKNALLEQQLADMKSQMQQMQQLLYSMVGQSQPDLLATTTCPGSSADAINHRPADEAC
jgi:hypothetical protein